MIDCPVAPCEDLSLSTRLVMLEAELAETQQQRDRLNGELAAARSRIAQLGELASRPLEVEEEPEAIWQETGISHHREPSAPHAGPALIESNRPWGQDVREEPKLRTDEWPPEHLP